LVSTFFECFHFGFGGGGGGNGNESAAFAFSPGTIAGGAGLAVIIASEGVRGGVGVVEVFCFEHDAIAIQTRQTGSNNAFFINIFLTGCRGSIIPNPLCP
jgi:hypothetical protein